MDFWFDRTNSYINTVVITRKTLKSATHKKRISTMHSHEKLLFYLQCSDNKERLPPEKCIKILDPFPCRIKKSSNWGGGCQEVSSPISWSKQCQLWDQIKCVTALSSQVCKIFKDGDFTDSPCNPLPILNYPLRFVVGVFFFKSSWNLPISIYEYCLLFSHHVTQ